MPITEEPSEGHRYASVVGCMACGRGRWVRGLVVCERCRRELAPTRVQRVLEAARMTIDDLAEAAEVSRRSAARAATGHRLAKRLATKVARVTGIPVAALMDDEPVPSGLRRTT